jgi:hypothetical protein
MFFAAELLGIPTPPPYLYLTGQSIAHGVNFATGGSGVTYASGTNPLGTQVDNLELFLRTDPYSKVALANSISLVAVDGNDYTTFNGNISNPVTIFFALNRIQIPFSSVSDSYRIMFSIKRILQICKQALVQ